MNIPFFGCSGELMSGLSVGLRPFKAMLKLISALCLIRVLGVGSWQNFYCQLSCDSFNASETHTVCKRQQQKCGPDPKCGPDFAVLELSNDDRQYIMDIHNYLRNKVAIGHEKRGFQPRAANMLVMNYNRELEFLAQCWANACNGNPLVHDRCRRTAQYVHVGQNLGYINSTDPKINKIKAIKDLILLWYDEVALFDSSWINDTQIRSPDLVVGHYTQLVWANSMEIGCAISYYTHTVQNRIWHQLILVCNYGPGGNYLGNPVYEAGKVATRCPKGMERNAIYKGLCGQTQPVEEVGNFTFDLFQLEDV
ncbi:venom allergen 5 2 isoform X2 [Dendroctonus ponderosae]|uniref:SCP domain-containing protein n=1 Tax=Dendroctonus ponderosae TaxID=77166 RepID=A0AAR5QI90_DENPD|nr:venom allergen 5 2 isoform X2 [Dendroctonus ponderosae]